MPAHDRSTVGACVVCGSTGLEPHLEVAGAAGPEGLIPTTDAYGSALADIVRCGECGHMQLAAFPGEEELGEAYGEAVSADYLAEEPGQRQTADAILERIERRRPPGALLDLGCWVGLFLAAARERGWSTTGVEPSDYAAAHARSRGLDVHHGTILGTRLPAASFDAVMLGDVIEHLIDPGAALDHVHRLLARGGVVALALPDAGSRLARTMGGRWWSVLPTHVQYFTRASLTRLLEGHGFEVLEVSTQPKSFTVRYYLGRLGGYSERLAAALVRAAERSGRADHVWTPDFRDRMLVIARRRD